MTEELVKSLSPVHLLDEYTKNSGLCTLMINKLTDEYPYCNKDQITYMISEHPVSKIPSQLLVLYREEILRRLNSVK